MVILGIDPGTATTGYGVVEFSAGQLAHLTHGTIRTSSNKSLPTRLQIIHEELVLLFERFTPDVVAVEQLFFNRNTTSALSVGHARGVVLLTAAQHGAAVVEYTPLQVKQGVSGEGRADKAQVAFMVRILLSLQQTPSPDDAADALAVAICHAHCHSSQLRIAGSNNGGWPS